MNRETVLTAAVVAIVVVLGGAALLMGCGGPSWTAADTASSTDSVHAQLMVERICSDGGTCVPSQVRALERAALCGNASMLARHKQPVPDAGIQCRTP